MKITQVPSPNFNERKDGKTPWIIVLHYTDTPDTKMALDDYLCNPKAEVSAHYVVEKDGNVLQLVDEAHRAWHAGKAHWRGEDDVNSASIGIEIVNAGHTYGLEPFPDAQIDSVIALCQDLMEKWDIAPENVVGHEDVAPKRKIDPGPLFPWDRLVAAGVKA